MYNADGCKIVFAVLTVGEFIFIGNCVHEVLYFLVCRGRQALGSLRLAAASQPSVTKAEGDFKVQAFVSVGWST